MKTKLLILLPILLISLAFISATCEELNTNKNISGTWIQNKIDFIKYMNISFATIGWYKRLDESFGGKLPGGIKRKEFIVNAGNRPGDSRSVIIDIYTGNETTKNFYNYNTRQITYVLNRDGIWYDESGKPAPAWFKEEYGGLNRYWIPEVAKQEEKVWRIK